MRIALSSPLLLLVVALPAAAQGRWKEVGKTAAGNPVSVDTRSVKTAKGITSARIRVTYSEPVKTPKGEWRSSQASMMFDCAKSSVAAKDATYYSDLAGTKIVDRTVISQPGFAPAIGGSMTKVALDYLCARK